MQTSLPEEPFTVRMEIKPEAFELPLSLFVRAIRYELQMITERVILERERRLG